VAPGWVVANLNVGMLYLFAISSLGVYGIIMGGWASNSKYPFLGGLRSAAQMVSYEVSIGFVIVTVLLLVGSLNISDVVHNQDGGFWNWHAFAFPTDLRHVPDVRDLLHLGAGRDEPSSVRSAGS
jgi:NADH-quinone oxidoreductase subunit H